MNPQDLGTRTPPSSPACAAFPSAGLRHTRQQFDRNAATYDRVNTAISMGLDALWRDWVAHRAVGTRQGARVLDAYSGTGLTGIRAAELGAQTTLVDTSWEMLALANGRAQRHGVSTSLVNVDLTAPDLPLPVEHFDAITVSFGVRYMDAPSEVLRGLSRLLKNGGRLVILEFTRPAEPLSFMDAIVVRLASAYFFRVLPLVAEALSGQRDLYERLVSSTSRIDGPGHLREIVRGAGLQHIETRVMGFGLVSGIVAAKIGR